MTDIWEADDSRTGSEGGTSAGRVVHYIISGTTDDAEVVTLTLATKPDSVEGYVYANFRYSKLGYDKWEAFVTYTHPGLAGVAKRPLPEVGGFNITITSRGASAHMDYALDDTYYAISRPAADMNNAIEFDGKQVHGIDKYVAELAFTVEYTIPGADLTAEYVGKVHHLMTRVNDDVWHGFKAEEVLLVNFTAPLVLGQDTTLTYEFLVEWEDTDHLSDLGAVQAPITKPGWWYSWVTTEFSVDAGTAVSKAQQLNLNQIYHTGDFDLLGLPLPETLITPYTPP